MRRLFRTLASAALAVGLVAAPLAAPATAATNPYTAKEICGSSYTNHVTTKYLIGAKIVVLRNTYLSKLCVVTIKTDNIGRSNRVEAWVTNGKKYPEWSKDVGYYKYYAGPVYQLIDLAAPDYRAYCIAYAGRMGPESNSYTSDWINLYPTRGACLT